MSTPDRSLGEQLKTGAKWSSAEIVLHLAFRLASLAILARLLTPTDFGVFAAAVTVIEFARPLGTLSMDHALVQSKSLSSASVSFAWIVALGLSAAVASIIALNADAIRLLYDDPQVPEVLWALAFSIPVAAMSGLLLAFLRRKLAFRELSIMALLSFAIASVTAIAAAAAGLGVWALVVAYYLELGLKGLFALTLVRPRPARPRIDKDARSLLRFGVGGSLSLMLNFWALHGDYVVIGSVLGSRPLGYYSRAYQLISTIPGMFGRLHNTVLFPTFSRAQSDRGYLKRALLTGTEATAALTLPLCAWGLVLAPEIIAVVLGPGWEETVAPFQILALGVYFRTGYRFATSIVFATGRVFAFSACQAVYAVLIVAGALYGAQWGIVGVAWATLVALLVFYLLLYALTARVSGAPAISFVGVHARPLLVFAIVLVTSALARGWLLRLDWPSLVVLMVTVTVSVVVLAGATRLLKERLWGNLVYGQGLAAVRRYTRAAEGESQDHDDISA